MRIAIDAINGNERIRGPDRYLIGLLQGLAEIDRDSAYLVFHARWQQHLAQLPLPANFRLIECRAPRGRAARVLWHALVFPRLLAQEAPDVVHLPNVIYMPRVSAPVLMTVHDLAHFRFPGKFGYLRGYGQRALIRRSVRLADRMIAVSQFTRADLGRFTAAEERRIAVILEGGPAPLDARSEAPPRPYFVYVGQVERSKNVEALVEAFAASALLREAGVELHIAGKPANAMPQVARLAARLAPERVKLLGYVEEGALPQLFANALAFVFPSLIEGFGLVLLEAMAFGAPIVASNASVIPEVVGDAALLVDATRHSELQHAMEAVYRQPQLREELRRRGRARLSRFSWREAAGLTLDEYRKLAP